MFILLYTEGCSLKMRTFKTMDKLNAFVGAFVISNIENRDDNYIDAIIHGDVMLSHSSIALNDTKGFQP